MGLDTLCRHNFEHNAIVGVSSVNAGITAKRMSNE